MNRLIRIKPALGDRGTGRYEVVYDESLHGNLHVCDLENLIRIESGEKVVKITRPDQADRLQDIIGNNSIVELEYACRVMTDVGTQVEATRQVKHHRGRKRKRHSRPKSGPPCGVSIFKYLRIRRSV